MKQFKKILVLSGPTGVGKTALAVNLAQKFNGELISADSRQVYKGMDIGTGKDIDQKSKIKNQNDILKIKKDKYSVGYFIKETVPLWLLDVVTPDQSFSVADYQKLAQIVIQDIWERGKLPILVGGTGLYIKSIIDGIETVGIPQNQKLREKLYKLNLPDLQNTLKTLTPPKWQEMNSSDQQNPRRLVRAIEISRYQGDSLAGQRPSLAGGRNAKGSPLQKIIFLHLSLTAPNDILYQRIDDRVEKRVRQGIIKEIKTLLGKGYTWDSPSMSACGYRIWQDYFEKKMTLKETIQKWKFEEHDYARRQLTWFKKDKRIKRFDITENNYLIEINKLISSFI